MTAATPAGNAVQIGSIGLFRDRADHRVREAPREKAGGLPFGFEPEREFVFRNQIFGALIGIVGHDLRHIRRRQTLPPAHRVAIINEPEWISQLSPPAHRWTLMLPCTHPPYPSPNSCPILPKLLLGTLQADIRIANRRHSVILIDDFEKMSKKQG